MNRTHHKPTDQHRAATLRLVADSTTDDEEADYLAATALPHLNTGQRWGHLHNLRALFEQHARLTLDGPTSIRRPGEDPDAHLTRDLNVAAARLTSAVEIALDGDFQAAMATTPCLVEYPQALRYGRTDAGIPVPRTATPDRRWLR